MITNDDEFSEGSGMGDRRSFHDATDRPMTTQRTLNPTEAMRGDHISSSQLANGQTPYAECRGNVRCIPDLGFRSCPSNDKPTSSTVLAGIGQNPRSWSINPNGASRLAWCARGIGLRFRLGFRSENFPISSMFYPTERPGDCMGMAAIMPSLFDVYQFKESEIY